MNHRPLIVIFAGILCLYAALIPLGSTAPSPEIEQDYSLLSPWLTADPDLQLALPEMRFVQRGLGSGQTSLLRAGTAGLFSAELQQYLPSLSARQSGSNPAGG